MGGVARAIPNMIKAGKMMDSGSSEQETRSYLESQGLRNIEITKNKPESESSSEEDTKQGETKRLLKTKRKGRSSTVLSSSSGVEGEASVSKKTLLGG